jgi:predicted RNA methylase
MSTQPPFGLRVVKDRSFVNQTLHLDGVSYENCHFIGCTLVYSGGEADVSSCYVHAGTVWKLQGPAAMTVRVLEQYGWHIEYGDGQEPVSIRFPSDAL